jgi:glycosyltransferase involved in cell wall biosynthesis
LAPRVGTVAVLTAGPAPYYMAALSRLSRLTGDRLAVRYVASSNSKRHWRLPVEDMAFDWDFLGRGVLGTTFSGLGAGAAMLLFLFRRRPSVVISASYDDFAAWVSLVWCSLSGRRLVLWTESNARDVRRSSRIRTWLKRLFVSRSDAVAALGKAAAAYARQLGMPDDRIFIAPFGGDGDSFAREAGAIDRGREKALRGYPSRLILYAGRLVREKGVFVMLEAFRLLVSEFADVGLLFVGDGPARADIEESCRSGPFERVFFAGQQPYERMPYFYALADMLVLPTFSDPYGYVVVEAFACGVPAVVSRVAGVVDDLLVERETGYTVDPGDPVGLAGKIRNLLTDAALLSQMRDACRLQVQPYGVEPCAQALFAAATEGR